VRPDLGLGDTVAIDVAGKKAEWTIVGIFRMPGNTSPPPVYTTNESLGKYLPEPGSTSSLRISTEASDADTQLKVSKALESALSEEGIQFSQLLLSTDWAAQQAGGVNVIIYFLLVMAVLIAVVGGIGLAGMMGINVMERTREIGVLRAVGARNGSIMRLVVLEGVIIGLISWVLALALSLPLTSALNYGVGQAIFNQDIGFFTIDWQGAAGWVAGSLIVASLASLLPAARATRLTIRDVLAYE
jgi:putative ABC transport system permease protein